MLSELAAPLLVLAGVFVSSYLTYLATTYRFRKKPVDPAERLFDYYEKLLSNLLSQMQEKDKLIDNLEASLQHIQQELYETKNLLADARAKLEIAAKQSMKNREELNKAKEALLPDNGTI